MSVSVFVSVFVSVSVFVGVFVGVNNIKGQSRLSFVCVFVSVPLPRFQTSMSFSTDGAIINKNFKAIVKNVTSLRINDCFIFIESFSLRSFCPFAQ